MQAPVLVLNANFEPINVCDLRRAVGLLITEKASLVVNGRGEIHTVNASFPVPLSSGCSIWLIAPVPV